jgi:aminobenzoyl-glutamate utilization protein B
VIVNGSDQPNVVPPNASVWYYFRETDYPHIKELREIGDNMARAAAMMTDTEVSMRILGAAWPQHMNKTVAETMYANILSVGLPKWDDADITLAKGIQKELKQPQIGLATQLAGLRGGLDPEQNMGGPSDDIGDVSWNVPTVTLGYPANIPNLPGHNWANAIAMATPIAHKGVTAGAKVQAMTVIDMLMRPELVQQAWDYFRNVQTKDQKYIPFISDKDQPALWLNEKIMKQYGPEMKKFYYDPAKYKTYLEQLGIKYPTVR